MSPQERYSIGRWFHSSDEADGGGTREPLLNAVERPSYVSRPCRPQRFGRRLLLLLEAGSLRVIAPSTMAPMSKAPSALAVFGYAELCSGCGKRIQKCSYHTGRKR